LSSITIGWLAYMPHCKKRWIDRMRISLPTLSRPER